MILVPRVSASPPPPVLRSRPLPPSPSRPCRVSYTGAGTSISTSSYILSAVSLWHLIVIIFSPVVVFLDVFGVFAGFVTIEIGACFVAVSRFTLCMLVSDLVDDKVDDLLLMLTLLKLPVLPRSSAGEDGEEDGGQRGEL